MRLRVDVGLLVGSEECGGSSVDSESGWGLLADTEVSCGLQVLRGSTSRDSLGLLQSLGPVLLRSELLRLRVELGSGLRFLPWVLGIELLGLSSMRLMTFLWLGLLGVFDLLGIGLAMILGRGAAHETLAADDLGPQLWRRKGVPRGVVE